MVPRAFLERVQESESWETVGAGLPGELSASVGLIKMLLVQRWLGLSDSDLIAEIDDRLSLRSFCGFAGGDTLPSSMVLADFRRQLGTTQPELVRDLATRWPNPGATAPLISVVSPVYRAEEIVEEFVGAVKEALVKITEEFEIVLIEDGSGDETWSRVAAACAADPRVKGVKLSRNFGQHQAITAGLEVARGQWMVVMDCDLQDDPFFISDLFAKAGEGYDIVLTVRTRREHGWVKNAFARLFAEAMNRLTTGQRADWMVGGYSMLSRRAVEAFRRMRDVHRHYLGILRWLGLPTAHVPVQHRPRYRGTSSYSPVKLLRHAIDGWVSHSNRLLYASVALGLTFLLAAIAGTLLVVVLYFVRGFAPGWPSLVVLILVCTASVLDSLGVLGIYVGKIFDQVRARPLYIVEHTLNV